MLPDTDAERTQRPTAIDLEFITSPTPLGLTSEGDALPTVGHIGRYALKYPIGEGGLGTVYAAHDPVLSRLIAIKTLNVELGAEEREQFNALFLNEARAAAGLSHPHIVTVHDAGLSDQGVYIAMELLKGKDLRQLLKDGWRPTVGQAVLIMRRVADALSYAHGRGVIHRDVKTANIFMVGRTQPRVVDFGIARVAHQHDADDLIAGSPYYMSPEQLDRRETDRRSDVFSLGVVLYELLTGERPFRGESLAEISEAVRSHQAPLAHLVNPAVPLALAEIAARAMEKKREQRYASARSLSRELRHWLEEHPEALGGEDERRYPKAWTWAAATAAVAVLGVSAVVALWPSSPPSPTPSAAQQVATRTASADRSATVRPAPLATLKSATDQNAGSANSTTAEGGADAAPSQTVARIEPAAADRTRLATKAPAAKPATPAPAKAKIEPTKAKPDSAPVAPAITTGRVELAVSPWADITINGRALGTTPPLNSLTLPEGKHTLTLRNDTGVHTVTVNVQATQPALVKHKFGT